MKKIIIFFALVTSVVIIGTAHRGLTVSAKSVTAENCLPAITELSKIYSRLNGYSNADWEDILPNIYDAEVTVNSKSAYQFDYETALSHLKKFFTNKTASDLLHRKNTRLFLSEGKMYFMSGFAAAPCPTIAFYNGNDYSSTPTAASLSDIRENNGTVTITVRYAITRDYDEKNKLTEFSETLTLVNDADTVKISSSTMVDKLFDDHPVYPYDIDNPLTDDMLSIMILLILMVSLLLAYSVKRKVACF